MSRRHQTKSLQVEKSKQKETSPSILNDIMSYYIILGNYNEGAFLITFDHFHMYFTVKENYAVPNMTFFYDNDWRILLLYV